MTSSESSLQSDRVHFLTLDEVLEIHSRLIGRYGGASGVRDMGMLESALYRPKTGYYDHLIEMAAALFESLIMNHPFIDGNKRVAFFATDVFLRINGLKFSINSEEAYEFLMSLFRSKSCNFENLEVWIRRSIVSAR